MADSAELACQSLLATMLCPARMPAFTVYLPGDSLLHLEHAPLLKTTRDAGAAPMAVAYLHVLSRPCCSPPPCSNPRRDSPLSSGTRAHASYSPTPSLQHCPSSFFPIPLPFEPKPS